MLPGASYTLAGPLRWCELDGDWVVFCAATGALHCTDKPTAALLALLEDAPATAAEIAQRFASLTEVEISDGVAAGIGDLLDELQRTGFVECEAR